MNAADIEMLHRRVRRIERLLLLDEELEGFQRTGHEQAARHIVHEQNHILTDIRMEHGL